MVICNQASQNDNAHPDQEGQYREPLHRSAVGTLIDKDLFPPLLVLVDGPQENGGHRGAHCHEKYFQPKRKGDEFTNRLPDHHKDSRGEHQP